MLLLALHIFIFIYNLANNPFLSVEYVCVNVNQTSLGNKSHKNYSEMHEPVTSMMSNY